MADTEDLTGTSALPLGCKIIEQQIINLLLLIRTSNQEQMDFFWIAKWQGLLFDSSTQPAIPLPNSSESSLKWL